MICIFSIRPLRTEARILGVNRANLESLIPQIENFTILEENVLRQISTLTYKFFFDPAQLEKKKKKKDINRIARRKSCDFYQTLFDEISSKIFLILLKFEFSTLFDFVYKKTIILEYLYFETKSDFTLFIFFYFFLRSVKFT